MVDVADIVPDNELTANTTSNRRISIDGALSLVFAALLTRRSFSDVS